MNAPVTGRTQFTLQGYIIDGLKTAGLAFLLSIGLIGFQTVDIANQLRLVYRLDDVAAVVILAFFWRIAWRSVQGGHSWFAIGFGLLVGGSVSGALLEILPALPNWLPPFEGAVINWMTAIAAAATAAYGVLKPLHMRGVSLAPPIAWKVATNEKVNLWAGVLLLLTAVALPMLPFADRKLVDDATLVLSYIMLGWGLNIVVGLAGLLDLGYVAFYAVGAYAYAMFAIEFDLSFWVALPIAGILAASFGVLLGFPVLRLRGDYLAIVTLGFGEMIRLILINWFEFTGGPNGIQDIPRPSFFGFSFTRNPEPGAESFHTFFGLEFDVMHRLIFFYYLILVLALVTNFFTLRMRRLPLGRAWEALREDETACRALGINPTNTKLTAFAIGAMFGGFAGTFFATRQAFISPESFTFLESAVILAIVVLGGMGSQVGVVLAAVLLIGLPEFLRELELYRMLFFGMVMVAIMLWRPRGLLAHRAPTLRFTRKKEQDTYPSPLKAR